MTRAEILDCLTDRPCDSCKFHESGRCERWDCVFEEKPDECEDAISRQAEMDFIRGLTRWSVRSGDGKFDNVGLLYDDVMFGLDRLPSVTPKQKVGHWILDHVVCDVIYEYHCSACGHHLELGGRTIKQDQAEGYSLFCNGCGAKMEVSENG